VREPWIQIPRSAEVIPQNEVPQSWANRPRRRGHRPLSFGRPQPRSRSSQAIGYPRSRTSPAASTPERGDRPKVRSTEGEDVPEIPETMMARMRELERSTLATDGGTPRSSARQIPSGVADSSLSWRQRRSRPLDRNRKPAGNSTLLALGPSAGEDHDLRDIDRKAELARQTSTAGVWTWRFVHATR